MSADFGGTELEQPIKNALTLHKKGDNHVRIFILTDGDVGNTKIIIDTIKEACGKSDFTKVFTFGIGSGCSI